MKETVFVGSVRERRGSFDPSHCGGAGILRPRSGVDPGLALLLAYANYSKGAGTTRYIVDEIALLEKLKEDRLEERYELTHYGKELEEIAAKRGLTLEQVVEVAADMGGDPEVLRVLIYKDYGTSELRRAVYESARPEPKAPEKN